MKVYHLLGRLNYVPDALSRLKALTDPKLDSRVDGDVVLDNVMFVFAEAYIE